MNDQLLALVSQYGAPALFGIVAIAAVGLPLPVTLLLLIAGSMISQGAMNLWMAIGAAGAGSILGDQAGYAIGRWGGPKAVAKLGRLARETRPHRSHRGQSQSLGRPRHFCHSLAAQSARDLGSISRVARRATLGIDFSFGTPSANSPAQRCISPSAAISAIASWPSMASWAM